MKLTVTYSWVWRLFGGCPCAGDYLAWCVTQKVHAG